MSGDSSSSTFHDFIILSCYNYQNFRSSKFQIFKFRNFKNPKVRCTGLSNKSRFSDSQISKIHISHGCSSIFSCIFWSKFMTNAGAQGSTTGPKNRFFASSKIHPKSIGIDQESIICHFGIIKTPNWQ